MSTDYTEFESKMKKTASVLTEQYDSVRAGKANPAVLDRITVDYYGSPTPIQQIASVSTPDARSLLIQPWDSEFQDSESFADVFAPNQVSNNPNFTGSNANVFRNSF